MVEVKKEGIVLEKTTHSFEDEGVLNPAVIREGNMVHMFYRAVRKGNYSTIGYCRFNGPMTLVERMDTPLLIPHSKHESHGIEDARIVKIDDLYYLTYTAYDGVNALGSLATSSDMRNFERHGVMVGKESFSIIAPLIRRGRKLNQKYIRFNSHMEGIPGENTTKYLWDKNVIFFPRRIDGKLFFLHRIKPDIQIAFVKELSDLTPEYWKNYLQELDKHILMRPKFKHEVSYIGGGCPPVETEHGWLLIYHGVYDTPKGYVYCACAGLLDLNDPSKLIARLPYPLISPELDWELKGEVNNVVFPTGTAQFEDKLYIYYGAADERIACASVNINDLLNELVSEGSTVIK
jgi:predicted GH43/DUF377 family glycosyl hydrolase